MKIYLEIEAPDSSGLTPKLLVEAVERAVYDSGGMIDPIVEPAGIEVRLFECPAAVCITQS